MANDEKKRLREAREGAAQWKKWGPYLSERQWGTVREDYSETGDAWNYLTHDQSRSRAYRWGEDGIAGISDDKQTLCFALALWNGNDPILKERMFGLTNTEGNHGEDVKEYYYYLDSSPTHSYMKYLYKYPQAAFPYADLVDTNLMRRKHEMEYELIDTGVFDDNRYFDVFVEYAKAGPEEILIKICAANRGDRAAVLHLLPTLWFRNTWSWGRDGGRPLIERVKGSSVMRAFHPSLGERFMTCEGDIPLLFTENETNSERLFGSPNGGPYVKDAFNEYVAAGNAAAVNPAGQGTKAAAHYRLEIAPGATAVVRLRLSDRAPGAGAFDAAGFDSLVAARLSETDEFYADITPTAITPDEATVMRQALAGMLWSKQYYYYDLELWLTEHGAGPAVPPSQQRYARNREWFHMVNDDIISMPDKWEYPWYAAWDLAFHMISLVMVDADFAKEQLHLMLREDYLHPNGQIPAYEWNFSDVNPPVHAWSTKTIYEIDKSLNGGTGDILFLKSAFRKLLLNFTWWVNRKDAGGNNIFEGGFLGLDNIGVFDRSSPLPTGGYIEQADGTAWMVFYCLCMLDIAMELAMNDPTYEELAMKFLEHALWIAGAMDRIGDNNDELWDEADGFFYDVLRLPNGNAMRLKVRSMVGLLPLCATAVFEHSDECMDRLLARAERFIARHPELTANIHPVLRPGANGRMLFCVMNEDKLRKVLARMLDENEFLGDFGVRALSRHHREKPFVFTLGREVFRVDYEPAESSTGLFGGNSNWRGPVWMPVNVLIVKSLINLYSYFGDDFTVECPTGSGNKMNLFQVAEDIGGRLARIFLRGEDGKRPVFGGAPKFQNDPDWKDHLLFYEYFHGDNGAGLGASHQTGWTGLVARLIQMFGSPDARGEVMRKGAEAAEMESASRSR